MIILIDNYDSFTYNVAQYLGDLGCQIEIHRNDKITTQAVLDKAPKGIVLSPGPSNPDQAGICLSLVAAAAQKEIPLLGICLGHQTIGQAFGGKIIQTHPLHGKTSIITHTGTGLFEDIPSPYTVTRYHSLIIEKESCPACLDVTAKTEDNIIMAVQHKTLPIHGVQFHPESIATEHGHTLLNNFVKSL